MTVRVDRTQLAWHWRQDHGVARDDGAVDHKGSVSRLQRYASFVPGIGDVVLLRYGAKEIKAAESGQAKMNAYVDLGRGVASSTHRLAEIPIYAQSALTMSPGLLAVAGPITAATGMVTTLIDGARDVSNGWKYKDLSDMAAGGAKLALGSVGAWSALMGGWQLLLATSLAYAGVAVAQNHQSVKAMIDRLRGHAEA